MNLRISKFSSNGDWYTLTKDEQACGFAYKEVIACVLPLRVVLSLSPVCSPWAETLTRPRWRELPASCPGDAAQHS